jgi:hypothetical protein
MFPYKELLEGAVLVDIGGFKIVHVDAEEVDEGFNLLCRRRLRHLSTLHVGPLVEEVTEPSRSINPLGQGIKES